MINGARPQERREAQSTVEEARAVMNNAQADMVRRQNLFAAGVISREEADRYVKEYEVAKARYEEMSHHHDLVAADAREEDRAMAEANLQLAKARLDESRSGAGQDLHSAPLSMAPCCANITAQERVFRIRRRIPTRSLRSVTSERCECG